MSQKNLFTMLLLFCSVLTYAGQNKEPRLPSSSISIQTTKAKYVGVTTAISGGIITNPNAEPIVSAGVCWSRNALPTVNDAKQVRTGSSDNFSCELNNLLPKTGYYLRAYVETSSGVIYGPQRTFATDSASVGMIMNGGNLFYVFKPGDPGYVEGEFHGLICSKRIGTTTVSWNNNIDTLIGATDSNLLGGKLNTQKIVSVLGNGTYPAKICDDFVSGGFSDWYLPSSKELLLIANASLLSGPNWSSTELSKTQANYVQNRAIRVATKTQKYYVIAVRSF